jgi:FtsP/CotA-like multicopper oxidase with cupredoxin domain
MTTSRRLALIASGLLGMVPFPVRVSAQPAATPAAVQPSATAVANDNRVPAGELKDGVLTLKLVATVARWQPEGQGATDPTRIVQVFAEEGKAPQIPGPLVRVPAGTEIRMSVRNAIAGAPLQLFGAMTRPGDPAAFVEIAPGAVRDLRFKAGSPGTYFYFGATAGPPLGFRIPGVDAELSGAFIVDPAQGREEHDDRIFLMTEYLGPPTASGAVPASLAINGRSWPFTERLALPFGKAATWRVINATFGTHPMHLHGTFYSVERLGTYAAGTIYDHDSRRLVTTEALSSGATMTMRWVPDRVGNWLFHCHIQAHVTGDMRAADEAPGAHTASAHGTHDVERSMAGLVLGINVLPGDETAAPDLEPHSYRPLTIEIESFPNRYGAHPGYGFRIIDPEQPVTPVGAAGSEAPPPNPSPTLVLQKNEPVMLRLANKTTSDTTIQWHGIELESYNDGVAGWSGDTRQTTKLVPAGGTLDVWFTPPRAGTFIYHTHAHDPNQLSSGMYSALLVVPDRAKFNAEAEKVVLLGGSGPGSADFSPAPFELNRSTNPMPMTLKAGTKYRFRLINISPNFNGIVSLLDDKGPVKWRAVAKDGADLPPAQAITRPAKQPISVGETYDFEYEPTAPVDLRLEVRERNWDMLTTQLVLVTK